MFLYNQAQLCKSQVLHVDVIVEGTVRRWYVLPVVVLGSYVPMIKSADEHLR